MHPVGQVLVEALDGRFPDPDGSWSRVPLWRDGVEGSVSLTGKAYVAVDDDITDETLEALGMDGLGGASNARAVAALAGEGYIECLDLVLGRRVDAQAGEHGAPLVDRPDLVDHPRVRLAQQLRSDVRVLGRPSGDRVIVTVGEGVGALPELGIEVAGPGGGLGAETVRAALAALESGTVVLASCSPGNVRAVRTFTAAGFVHLGEVQLWCPRRGDGNPVPGP